MKYFIQKVLYFLLPILIVVLVMELLVRHIPNDYSYKKEYLDKNSNHIQVLFLGNSHIFYGIDPQYLSYLSFNAGYISQSLDLDLEILKKYDHHWHELKYVIIPIDYFSLYERIDTGVEVWRLKNYALYYDIPTSNSFHSNFEIYNPIENVKKIKYYYIYGNTAITSAENGWGKAYNSSKNQDLETTGKDASERHTFKDNHVSENIQILNKMIDFCAERNIRVIMLTAPAYKTYSQNLDPMQLNTTLNAIHNSIASHSNASYINLLQDTSFIKEDFYDADHLNEIGAKKLTLKVNELLKKQ